MRQLLFIAGVFVALAIIFARYADRILEAPSAPKTTAMAASTEPPSGGRTVVIPRDSRGHFQVNGRRVNIPSYLVRPDDVITVAEGSSAEQVIRDATDLTASVAAWSQADHEALTGKILKLPERSEIDTPVQESLIVELYSK